ncbi:hypothetical protein bpSLO_001327 (plasmid) [Borrelia parkeri]|nr:hypothetical protein bpSLO_001327 [Borrelia parkeri]
MYFTNNDINAKNIPILRVIRVPNIQLCSLSLLSRSLISDFNSLLTVSILLSRSLMSDFSSLLTLSILLSSSLNLVSILMLRLFSTVSILLSSSLNLVSILVLRLFSTTLILLSRSLISDLKVVSTL